MARKKNAKVTLTLPQARKTVRDSLKTLEILSAMFRGRLEPGVKEAFKVVLKASHGTR